MTAFFVIPPILLLIGLAFAIFPVQSGTLFCRLGKTIWRIQTFGLTDMHWFYREDKVGPVARRIGIVFVLFGLIFGGFAIASFCGPNLLAAMREAENFLHAKHGSSHQWRLSCKSSPDGQNAVDVEYRYSGARGVLHGTWTGTNYRFTEIPDNTRRAPR